jgi:membrane dipeptidase
VPPESREEPDFDSFATPEGYDVPLPPPLDQAYAYRVTASAIDQLFRWEAESGGRLKVARSVDEIVDCLRKRTVAAVIHLEGADALDPGLDALHEFHAAGLRSVGIVWSRPNAFGCGTPFKFPGSPDSGDGLTAAGKDLVRECNRLGIMLDLAHLNERGFWDVAALSDAPLVVTHAGVHAVCPSTRNLTDKQLDAIGESKGVVGVAFHVGFIRADGRQEPDMPLTEIVRHIDYIVGRIGIECVAIGSDFDDAVPQEMRRGLPKLVRRCARRAATMMRCR